MKALKKICCFALCLALLLGVLPAGRVFAAEDRLDALSAYYEYLLAEEALIGIDIQDKDYYKMFTDNTHSARTMKITGAWLMDVTGDGLEELLLKRYVEHESSALIDFSNCDWLCVYTYRNGQLVRIAQSGQWIRKVDETSWTYYEPAGYIGEIINDAYTIYCCTGTDGRITFTHDHPTAISDEIRWFYGFTGNTFETILKLESIFYPDWYISPDLYSSYGEYKYYMNGSEVSYNTFHSTINKTCASYFEMSDNNYKTVMNSLASQLTAYYTPSSWAITEVNMAISNGYVPQSLQKNYTKAITRLEFCALATAFYEAMTGQEITEREYFDDCSDVNVQKMAGLGIVNGTGDGKFTPNKNLNRQEAATILARLAENLNMQTGEAELTFADNAEIDDWAKAAVSKMLAAGVINGVGNNRFNPRGHYTREQAIVTILRLSMLPIGDPIPVDSITLSPATVRLLPGQETTLTVTLSPADATEKKLTWASSNAAVAVVDKKGKVTAIDEGTATITVEAPSGAKAECTVTVDPIQNTAIALDRSTGFVSVGGTLQLNAILTPANASTKHITWTSSDEAVATVSPSGLVTGVQEGSAVITAESFGHSAKCTLTVSTEPLGLANFVKTAVYNGHFTDVSSSDWYEPNVAAAYEYGLMNGTAPTLFNPGGNVTVAQALVIACRIHNIYYENNYDFSGGDPWYQPYVLYAMENGIVQAGDYADYNAPATRTDFAIALAASVPLEALAPINDVGNGIPDVPPEMYGADSIYLLYNAGILSGNNSYGDFRPQSTITRAEAAAIITRIADPTLRKTFTLVPKVIPAQSMSFANTYEGMRIGETEQLTLHVNPSNATLTNLTFTSSNPAVATVDPTGSVTALAEGQTTITARLGALSASCTVDVARADVVYTGKGDAKLTISLPQGAYRLEYVHTAPEDATGYQSFEVKGVYDMYPLIQDSGNCSGSAFLENAAKKDLTDWQVDVDATGEWTLRIVEVNEVVPKELSGSGNAVPGLVYLGKGWVTVTLLHEVTSSFSMDIYNVDTGDWNYFSFINSTSDEAYVSSAGYYVIAIDTDSDWSIRIED